MQDKSTLEDALAIMRDLRARCEWDRAQTHESLRPYLIEEAHELDDALREADDEKVGEELREVLSELAAAPVGYDAQGQPVREARHDALEAELGDLLFAVVNLCRKAGVHASLALDKANAKFERRFAGIERLAAERGIDVKAAGLATLDGLWDEVKAAE